MQTPRGKDYPGDTKGPSPFTSKLPAYSALSIHTALSCYLLQQADLVCLRAPGAPLYDVELDGIAFFQRLVAVPLYRAIVNENIGTILVSEETKTFGIVEPFHASNVLCHDAYLLSSIRLLRAAQEIRPVARTLIQV